MTSAQSSEQPAKPVTVAYEVATRRDRFTEKAINRILIIFTFLVNWILLWGGFTRLWGLYVALIFLMVLVAVDVARLTYELFAAHDTMTATLPAYMSAPFTQSDVRVYIVIWLVWFVVTQFFFLSGTSFSTLLGVLTSVPMLIATVLVGVSPLERSLARNLFPLFALLALAFPSRHWMPQQEWWVFVVLRVVLYFTAVVVASYALPRRELTRELVKQSVTTALSLDQRKLHIMIDYDDDEEDAERATFAIQLSTIIAHYQELCNYERERTLAIIALSAWILLVSRLVALSFGAFLIVFQLVLFFIRRREFDKQLAQKELYVKIDKTAHDVVVGAAVNAQIVRTGTTPPPPPTTTVGGRQSPTQTSAPVLPATGIARGNQLVTSELGDNESTDDAERSVETSLDDDETSGSSLEEPRVMTSSASPADDVHKRRLYATTVATTNTSAPPNAGSSWGGYVKEGVRTNRVTIKTK